jgi:hypothetical protein
MTREEILNLDKLSEGEQVEWLLKNHIIKNRVVKYSWGTTDVYESLADCAFRLRGEVLENIPNGYGVWVERLLYVMDNVAFIDAYRARPIHWIMAALLAKGEGE